ncbi:hypothetical protein IWW36_001150 [Coemansia brasiliensis]|uniref:Uncharacterized protein n=1 Tax=Coemansia brasiliensis TaxID=2650707 RepID=A0A9W8M140_9FUNG|nr:hypothetical protein IWW36_001150 [Coemansia brasiliensis]
MYVTRRSLQNGLYADVQLANAGFFANNRQQPYNVPRHSFNISRTLEESIFPFADELPSFDSMTSNDVGHDAWDTIVRFCNLLKVLRMVLLQDMAILFDVPFYRRMLQKSALFSSDIFQSLEFVSSTDYIRDLSWSSDFLPLVESQPYDAKLAQVVPSVVTSSKKHAASEDPAEATNSLENGSSQAMANDPMLAQVAPSIDIGSNKPAALDDPVEAEKPLEDDALQDMPKDDSFGDKPITNSAPTAQADQFYAHSDLVLVDDKLAAKNTADQNACNKQNELIASPKVVKKSVSNQKSSKVAIWPKNATPVAKSPLVQFTPIQPRTSTASLLLPKPGSQKRNLDSSEPVQPESKRLHVENSPISYKTLTIQQHDPTFIDLTMDDDGNSGMEDASTTNVHNEVDSSSNLGKDQSLIQNNRHVIEPTNPIPLNMTSAVSSSGDQESAATSTTMIVDSPASDSCAADESATNRCKIALKKLSAVSDATNGQLDEWFKVSQEGKENNSSTSTDSDQTLAVADNGYKQCASTDDKQDLADSDLYKKAALADKLLAAMHNLQTEVSLISENNQAMLRKIARIINRQKHPPSPVHCRHAQEPADSPQGKNSKLLYSLDKLQIVARRTNDHVSKLASTISQTIEEADEGVLKI